MTNCAPDSTNTHFNTTLERTLSIHQPHLAIGTFSYIDYNSSKIVALPKRNNVYTQNSEQAEPEVIFNSIAANTAIRYLRMQASWLPCDFIDPVKTLCLYLTSQFEAINAKVAVSVSATAD